MIQGKASIIIRTKNEEKWINSCLQSVFNQDYADFEVIIVDDRSTDRTLQIVANYNVKLVHYDKPYFPGLSLNEGIRAASGEYIVLLSGHCIPVNAQWLSNLISNFGDDGLAGVYGRQEPLPYTADGDKRDLWTVFQLDKKIQRRDCFFHNANSVVRKSVWDAYPFSETATNIEDRIWAKEVIDAGFHLIYEPEASVYHWHGIHQNDNETRRRNVVRIIESMQLATPTDSSSTPGSETGLETLALIPMKGKPLHVKNRSLLSYTLERALESELVNRVIVATDNEETAELAKSLGAEVPFLRPAELSFDYVGANQVAGYMVNEMGRQGYFPDLVVLMKETHPFRPKGLIDELIREMLYNGNDTLIPVHPDLRTFFRKENGKFVSLEDTSAPQQVKEPIYAGNVGLGKVIKGEIIRAGYVEGSDIGIYPIENSACERIIKNHQDAEFYGDLLEQFWKEQG